MSALRASSVRATTVRSTPRARAVRPVAALNREHMKAAAVGVASIALAASVAAPAEAANVLSTVAAAAEGYPFVPPAWAPSVLVPLTGLVIPGVAMAVLFNYIEAEK